MTKKEITAWTNEKIKRLEEKRKEIQELVDKDDFSDYEQYAEKLVHLGEIDDSIISMKALRMAWSIYNKNLVSL